VRILLVNDYAALFGGAEIRMAELRDELRRRGHDARLLATTAGGPSAEHAADYTCYGTTSSARTALQTVNPWAARSLKRALDDFRPEVVHVKMFLTQLSPLVLPPLRSVPALYHAVWYRPICPIGTKLLPDGGICRVPAGAVCYRSGCVPLRDWPLHMLQLRLWRRWRHAFDLVVANSHAVASRLAAEGVDLPIEVVWNGVPVVEPRPALAGPPTVAFAGRLVREKGVAVLLQAFARCLRRLPEARLVIVGDGPERAPLERLAAELDLGRSAVLTGRLPRDELERRLAGAWVQAVPSLWEEPFGNVAVEAMMRGTAVVATSAGGLAEIVRDGETGMLVPRGDVAALAEALSSLLSDRDLAERLGRQGRELALRDFTETVQVDRLESLYERLQASSSGVAPSSSGTG
jgi:glycosyltransferase involved in cell wall biosynthesis